MKQFVMCKGLPASGKSSWAEQQVLAREPGKAVRINRDLIREMLHANRFGGRKTENFTVTARDLLIVTAFARSVELVICDDTNLDPKVHERLESLAKSHGYEFRVQDFTDVPVSTCIERDLKRSRSVGEKVIKRMFAQYLEPEYKPIEADPNQPWAVIVDVDGTLAHMVPPPGGKVRSPFDWSRVGEDQVDDIVRDLVIDAYKRGDQVIVLSGRDGSCRDETKQWLGENDVPWHYLFMREAGDQRKDSIVKAEIFDNNIAGNFNIRYVLDDRDQVVTMWRARGLKVLQVEPGDF